MFAITRFRLTVGALAVTAGLAGFTALQLQPRATAATITDALRSITVSGQGEVLAAELGILEKTEGYCLRATFIVDPQGVIQWVDVNQGRVGRNVAEVIRVLDALQSDELCPCNWNKGDDVLKV